MKIELLYWRDCPSYPEAQRLLEQVLAAHGLDEPVELHEVTSDEEAQRLGFPGSPTIRVDGRDIDPAGAAAARPALTCRIYHLPDGHVSPVPTREQLEEAFRMTLALGTEAPQFDLPGVDGRDHSLDEYADADVLVLIQSCNHCPYVQAWEERMSAIARNYEPRGVRVIAVNSNDAERYPEDSFEEMRKRAQARGFAFDYLYDEPQSVARELAAARTPEVFVFDKDRRLVYHGAIDDSRDEGGVTQQFLRDALDAVLAGQDPPLSETPAVGCTVKWK